MLSPVEACSKKSPRKIQPPKRTSRSEASSHHPPLPIPHRRCRLQRTHDEQASLSLRHQHRRQRARTDGAARAESQASLLTMPSRDRGRRSQSQHAQSDNDFLSKMSIALKEADETDYWLNLLHDNGYLNDDQHSSLNNDIQRILRLLNAIVKSTKKRIEDAKNK